MLRRLHEPLTKAGSAALVLLPLSPPAYWQALDAYTHLRLQIERQAWLYQGYDIAGYQVQVTVLKDRSRPGTRQTVFDLTLEALTREDGL